MMIKKVKAFTLFEVTISMLITGLIIGITYAAYQIISVNYNAYISKQQNISNLNSLDNILKRDVLFCDLIIKSEDKITLLSSGISVSYEFSDSLIQRTSTVKTIDSFRLNIDSLRFNVIGVTVDNEDIIDEIFINGNTGKTNIVLGFKKKYSAEQLNY